MPGCLVQLALCTVRRCSTHKITVINHSLPCPTVVGHLQVEYARSSQASCQGCKEKIMKVRGPLLFHVMTALPLPPPTQGQAAKA